MVSGDQPIQALPQTPIILSNRRTSDDDTRKLAGFGAGRQMPHSSFRACLMGAAAILHGRTSLLIDRAVDLRASQAS